MRIFAFASLLLFVVPTQPQAQTQTNTTCNTSGSTTHCTSTTDNSDALAAERQRENYQSSQQIGSALGRGLSGLIQRHRIKSYCKKHPGYTWALHNSQGDLLASGTCPSN